MGQRSAPFPAAQEFGARVRARRRELGMSLEGLGEVSGLHWTYVGSVERGERNISLLNIIRLSVALEVDPSTFLHKLKAG